MTEIDENVFWDAARRWAQVSFPTEGAEEVERYVPEMAGTANLRAAVGSAYRAGEQTYATRLRALVEQRMTAGAQIPTIPPGTPPTAVALWEWIRLLIDEAIR